MNWQYRKMNGYVKTCPFFCKRIHSVTLRNPITGKRCSWGESIFFRCFIFISQMGVCELLNNLII
jgi:hypothetical protein